MGEVICRLEFGDMPYMAREETSKYTDLMKDGNARMFTWVMDAKSVVTSPSPEKPVLEKGVHRAARSRLVGTRQDHAR